MSHAIILLTCRAWGDTAVPLHFAEMWCEHLQRLNSGMVKGHCGLWENHGKSSPARGISESYLAEVSTFEHNWEKSSHFPSHSVAIWAAHAICHKLSKLRTRYLPNPYNVFCCRYERLLCLHRYGVYVDGKSPLAVLIGSNGSAGAHLTLDSTSGGGF